MIENANLSFILCGSSARKLKRGQANLLGGRAWKFELMPFTCQELSDSFDMIRACNHGLIPNHYFSDSPRRSLQSYVEDYLNEEIRAEALTRNVPSFARFLDAAAFSHAELVVFSNIAKDCLVDPKTVKEYFQILCDTLIGYFVYPYRKKYGRKQIIETPKFYFFDVGLANYFARSSIEEMRGPQAGKSFETLVFMELLSFNRYKERHAEINFWRTRSGVEVDFVINHKKDREKVAIECKVSSRVNEQDCKGLVTFLEDHRDAKSYLICNESEARVMTINGKIITVLPFFHFIRTLWEEKIF